MKNYFNYIFPFSKITKLLYLFRGSLKSHYYGFIQGHYHLSNNELKQLKKAVGSYSIETANKFESQFSNIIGHGKSVSYATGRMSFFALMNALNIGKGDEVVLQGATCSVMANAIIRTGAKPVYADIDPDTFGSTVQGIDRVLTEKTRMIVAQHSFGIPCDIDPIVRLAKSKGIFLLEDCALTLGSEINNIVCGNFGDAALFSTDHSKPINTITGGLIYTKNTPLYLKLKNIQNHSESLSIATQKKLWKRLIFERKYCRPRNFSKYRLLSAIYLKLRYFDIFAGNDFGSKSSKGYPYPAKMPDFLMNLGLIEISRWKLIAEDRLSNMQNLIRLLSSEVKSELPACYFNPNLLIIPLRFVWSSSKGNMQRNDFSNFLDVSWTWFLNPIIATSEPLENFQYIYGSCPIAESVGPGMVNLPCNISNKQLKLMMSEIKKNTNI